MAYNGAFTLVCGSTQEIMRLWEYDCKGVFFMPATASLAHLKKLATLAMLSAIAYLAMLLFRIPIVLFLKYDPKDTVIAIAGFLYGPASALYVSLAVSAVEMLTVSDTGWIGFVMNVLSSCAFVCPAAFLYSRKRTIRRAAAGLGVGVVLVTAAMALWNYIMTPIYMGYPREAVAELLLPAFIPFNLLKAGLNTALTLLLYKPVNTALRHAGLLPPAPEGAVPVKKTSLGVTAASLLLLASCILLALVFMGII